jgi:hypothetical protein
VVTDENAIEFARQVWSLDAQQQAPTASASASASASAGKPAQYYMASLFRLLK